MTKLCASSEISLDSANLGFSAVVEATQCNYHLQFLLFTSNPVIIIMDISTIQCWSCVLIKNVIILTNKLLFAYYLSINYLFQ